MRKISRLYISKNNLNTFWVKECYNDCPRGKVLRGSFLGNCKNLKYVDGPAKTNRKFYYNADTKSKYQIGKVALDDNKDGKPDSGARYDYFLQESTIHRYLFVDHIDKSEKDKDPEKDPDPVDGSDEENSPSARVDNPSADGQSLLPMTVTINGVTYYKELTITIRHILFLKADTPSTSEAYTSHQTLPRRFLSPAPVYAQND
ncbi:hypothetical protein [Butyrivibrio sp. JL13D10]|uniref:hypothetical protein n=1 Tax=Butyrivibrio sp. JL13D10 TaxID=3236815 RepID=UPI0038B4503B